MHERRHEAVEQPEHVVADEDLPVASGTGADADGWNRQGACDVAGDVRRNGLEHQRKRAGVLQGERVGRSALPPRRLCRLLDVATHLMDRLRLQAEVTHHRNADVDQPLSRRPAPAGLPRA